MSGLLRDNLYEELVTEISWLKSAVLTLSSHLKVSTYVIALLRHHVEPEEAQALERVIFLNTTSIVHMPFEDLRLQVALHFKSTTGKDWHISDEVLDELLRLKLRELNLI